MGAAVKRVMLVSSHPVEGRTPLSGVLARCKRQTCGRLTVLTRSGLQGLVVPRVKTAQMRSVRPGTRVTGDNVSGAALGSSRVPTAPAASIVVRASTVMGVSAWHAALEQRRPATKARVKAACLSATASIRLAELDRASTAILAASLLPIDPGVTAVLILGMACTLLRVRTAFHAVRGRSRVRTETSARTALLGRPARALSALTAPA